jgi:hypothetical protein
MRGSGNATRPVRPSEVRIAADADAGGRERTQAVASGLRRSRAQKDSAEPMRDQGGLSHGLSRETSNPAWLSQRRVALKTVGRREAARGFESHPRRWPIRFGPQLRGGLEDCFGLGSDEGSNPSPSVHHGGTMFPPCAPFFWVLLNVRRGRRAGRSFADGRRRPCESCHRRSAARIT